MYIDFHCHCNSNNQEDISNFVRTYAENDMMGCLSGGLRYGAHDYIKNEDTLAIAKKYPNQLRALAKIDLWDSEINTDIIYKYADMGFSGFKFIYPYYEYDHDLYMPVYEAAEKTNLPVLFHTGNFRPSQADTIYRRPVIRNMDPMTLDRIARSFQKLNIVAAHLGTTFWRTQAAELAKLHANLYCDLAGNGSWQMLSAEEIYSYFKSSYPASGDNKHFRKLIFGSDAYITSTAPMTSGKANYLMKLKRIGLPSDIIDEIMGGTVAKWLNI